jgi:hypothetical protein
MRFFGTTVTKYAVVDTDVFAIRVDASGELSRWDHHGSCWVWFDTEKFSDEEIAMVKQQGLAALEMK